MRNIKKGSIILIVLCSLMILSTQIWAKERPIYVGDIITLKIETTDSGKQYTPDELKTLFQDFEIIDIAIESDGYLITMRTFETGTKTITIGNQDIVITVASTLEDIDREDIYEADMTPLNASWQPNWMWIFYGMVVVFIISGSFWLISSLKKRGIKPQTAYELFKHDIASIEICSESFFVVLTVYMKAYIEAIYGCQIIGKTSKEILRELQTIGKKEPEFMTKLEGIEVWLNKNDYYKFSGVACDISEKEVLIGELIEIVDQIEALHQIKIEQELENAKDVT